MQTSARVCAVIAAVAGTVGTAAAQNGTVCWYWTVSDTGNGDGVIDCGESALLTLWALANPANTGFADAIYDITGDGEWDKGTLDSWDNYLDALTGEGNPQPNNDIWAIQSYQLPQAFNPDFDPSNPIAVYHIQWTPNSYVGQTVTITNGAPDAFIYTDQFGTQVLYTGDCGSIAFQVANCSPGPICCPGGRVWKPANPAHSPPTWRQFHSMAFDENTGMTVLFGGDYGSGNKTPNDTWEWDGADWHQRQAASPSNFEMPPPNAQPGGRRSAAMAFDPTLGRVILHGGRGYDVNGAYKYLGDLWSWDATTWTWSKETVAPPAPQARWRHAMVTVPTGEVQLYGGATPPGVRFDDTWTWNGAGWSKSAGTGVGRELHGLATTDSGALLFGGLTSQGRRDDTWALAGTTWTLQTPPTAPSKRQGHAMAGNPCSGEVVLFGGIDNVIFADTWVWNRVPNPAAWSQVSPAISPKGRHYSAIVYDSWRDEFVMFSGLNGDYKADTWVAVCCPADYNADWNVDTADILAFLGDWSIKDPRADINGDGVVNTQDFLAFMNIWQVKC